MDQHEKNARLFFDLKAFAPDDRTIRLLSAFTPGSYQQFASRYGATRPDCTISNLNPADFTAAVERGEVLCVIDSMSQLNEAQELHTNIVKGRTEEGQFQLQGEFRVQHNALKLEAKQHKKRRNQSESYHRRIQKKWNKQAAANNRYQPVMLSLPKKVHDAITKLSTTFNEALYTVDKP